MLLLSLSIVLGLCISTSVVGQEERPPEGYRLEWGAGYLIVCPQKVRPGMHFRLRVSVYKMYHESIQVVAHLAKDGEQYAEGTAIYNSPDTKMIELDVPDYIEPGQHKLVVEGQIHEDSPWMGHALFRNDTNMTFETKHVSLFIQTDKGVYNADWEPYVLYRVVGVTQDLKPVYGPMTIFVVDAGGNIVRRWLNQQLNIGVTSGRFQLRYPVRPGTWKMRVDAFGHIYEQPFEVEFFYNRRIEVNITMPQYVFDTEWGVAGSFYAEHMYATLPAGPGNATIMLWLKDDITGNFLEGNITKHIHRADKAIPFEFTMLEMREKWNIDLANHSMLVKGWFYDWFLVETQNGTATTRIIKDGVKVTYLGRQIRTFKPGFPFTIYYAVTRTDGTHYTQFYDRTLGISVVHEGTSTIADPEDRAVIPDDGILSYEIVPLNQDNVIRVRAWHTSGESTADELFFYRSYSQHGQYLGIQAASDNPMVDTYMIFTVRTNVNIPELNYVIMAGGNIIIGNTLTMNSVQKSFSIALSREMAPMARIVAYFKHQGEVVSDSLNFPVRDTRLSTASMSINLGKDFSQDSVEFIGFGSPGGYVYFAGNDHQWWERGVNVLLTEDDVADELMTYDDGNEGPFKHIWYHDDPAWDSMQLFTSPSSGMDTLQIMDTAGLYIFSDMNLTEIPDFADTLCNVTLGLWRCPISLECFEFERRCDGAIDCQDGYDETGCPMVHPPQRRPPDFANLHRQARHYADVEWMWQTAYIMPNGRTEIQSEVPESTDSYIVGGFVIHPEEGLSLIRDPPSHACGRPFYMIIEMPETSKRGEQIGIRASIFNYQEETLEVLVTLHGSDDYRFVTVPHHGYVSSYSPRTVAGDVQTMVLMEAGMGRYVHFPILPTIEAGEITITITASTFYDSDTEERSLSIGFDGVINDDYVTYQVDLVNQGSLIIPDFDVTVPDMFVQPEERWHLYVPGSEEAVVQIFGDVVTPGFFDGPFTTDSYVGVPWDVADGYMFDFAVNLQIMHFLRETNQLDSDTETEMVIHLISLLQRQYAYLQDDGSFKQYRRSEQSCLWTTQFVLRWLHRALDSQWAEEIYVDTETINKIALWLTAQQKYDGSFAETSNITYYRLMKPNSTDEDGVSHEWNIALTSEVAVTLNSLTRITGEAKVEVDLALIKVAQYLSEKWNLLTDPYQTAVAAFALHKIGHSSKDNAFLKLHEMRRESEFVYWSFYEIPRNPEIIVDNIPIMGPRPDDTDLCQATTATSLALIMYLSKEGEVYQKMTIPIMRWLQTQRVSLTGWAGPQDTLVVLEALTEFGLQEKNRFLYHMEIQIEGTMTGDWHTVYNMNASTFPNLFAEWLPYAHGEVKMRARGTGYAIATVTSFFNVEYDFLMANPDYEPQAYLAEMTNLVCSGKNCSNLDATFCFSWNRPDVSETVSQSVIAMEIPTGFVVSRDGIEALYRSGVPGLKRVRFRDQILFVFLEYVTEQTECIEFRMERWYPVANVSIQHIINTFEYEETGIQFNTLYSTWTLFNTHICMACGSFQCPYCPFYNRGVRLKTDITMHWTMWLTMLIGLYLSKLLHYTFPIGMT